MLRLSACTADCVLGCGLIETAHIHNSSSSSTSSPPRLPPAASRADAAGCARNEPPPPFRVVIWARTRAHCAQWDFKKWSPLVVSGMFLPVCPLAQCLSCAASKFIFTSTKYSHTHTHSSGSCNSSAIISSRSCCTLGFHLVARRVIIAGQSHWGVFSCARELCVGSAGNDYGKCKLKCSTQQIVKLKVLLSAFQFGIYLAHENNSIIAKWILYYGRGCSA